MINIEDEDTAWDIELKPRERQFVLHYCADQDTFLNAAGSYRKAYTKTDRDTGDIIVPLDSTCEVNGSKLLRRDRVALAIRKLLKLTQADLDEKNVYKLLKELETLTFFNPAEILNPDGTLKVDSDLDELGKNAMAIAQIKPGVVGKTLPEVTLVDRRAYMDLMLKYLNIVRPDNQISIELPVVALNNKAESIEAWNEEAMQED